MAINKSMDILKFFSAVHARRRVVKPGPAWRESLMERIRVSELCHGQAAQLAQLERLVWRFAAAAALVAMLMTAYTVKNEPGAGMGIHQALVDYPSQMAVYESLGL